MSQTDADKMVAKAVKEGPSQFMFAHPISEDAREAFGIVFGKRSPDPEPDWVPVPCGSCGMMLALSAYKKRLVEEGSTKLRCPLCAALVVAKMKQQAGGFAYLLGDSGERTKM